MGAYSVDREWSDRFLPAIRNIVGPLLLVPSPIRIDNEQAADLIIMHAKDIRIACRVRRNSFIGLYAREFTIRSSRDSGARTELAKIVEDGFGDWFFYGFEAAAGSDQTAPWYLIDLAELRDWLKSIGYPKTRTLRDESGNIIFHLDKRNPDGTHFAYFKVEPLYHARQSIIIASNKQVLIQPIRTLEPFVSKGQTSFQWIEPH